MTSPEKKGTEEPYEVRKTKTRTLLTNKKELRPSSKAGIRLEKLPEKTLKSTTVAFGASETINSPDNQLSTFKNANLTREEQDFIKEYRQLEELEREKGIKFFQCVGDEPITGDTI